MKMERKNSQTETASERKTKTLEVIDRRIDELKLNPRNPRQHKKKHLRQLGKSIKVFGFNVPVLIDSNESVIAGHGRVLAALMLGLTYVPTIMVEHLSESQAKAFMLVDNRLTELSEWDEQLLAEQLRDLSLQDLDFSLEATGFEMAEIDLKIESLSLEEKEDRADSIPALTGCPVTRAGDLWRLMDHLIVCAGAQEEGSYTQLMDTVKASTVFIDPPYNLRIHGHVSGLGAIKHREFVMGSGEMSPQEYEPFLTKVLALLVQYSVDGSIHFVCIDWRHLKEMLAAGGSVYTELKNVCVWVKSTPGMGSLYRSAHELIFGFKNGRARHRNNIQLGQYGRNRTNVWTYPGINSFGRSGEEGNLLALHPTVKPVRLVVDALLDCSARGDIVLDSFLGSGTTLVAAERTGRKCRGIELDPLYVDVAIRRWQALTGDKAIHVPTGRSFAELEEETEDDHAGR